MKINGKDWIADNEIFGAFHPKGYNNAIIIAGNKGKKDKNQQSFNLNLFNTNGPATFNIVHLHNLIQHRVPDRIMLQIGQELIMVNVKEIICCGAEGSYCKV